MQRIANNLAFASRSFMRSAYVLQTEGPSDRFKSTTPTDPFDRKLPTDEIIPDINVKSGSKIEDPPLPKVGDFNEPPPYELDTPQSKGFDANPSDRIENSYSTQRGPNDVLDEVFHEAQTWPDMEKQPSSAEKLRGGQSPIGQVPNASESNSAQEASGVDSNESSGFKETAKQYMADVKDKLSDVKENIKEKANDYKEDVVEKATSTKQKQDQWLNKSSDRYEDLKQEAKEKTNDTVEKIKEMPHIIKEKVKDFTGIGKRH